MVKKNAWKHKAQPISKPQPATKQKRQIQRSDHLLFSFHFGFVLFSLVHFDRIVARLVVCACKSLDWCMRYSLSYECVCMCTFVQSKKKKFQTMANRKTYEKRNKPDESKMCIAYQTGFSLANVDRPKKTGNTTLGQDRKRIMHTHTHTHVCHEICRESEKRSWSPKSTYKWTGILDRYTTQIVYHRKDHI